MTTITINNTTSVKTLTMDELKELVKAALEEAKESPNGAIFYLYDFEEDGDYYCAFIERSKDKFYICAERDYYFPLSRFPEHEAVCGKSVFANEDDLTEDDLKTAKYWL